MSSIDEEILRELQMLRKLKMMELTEAGLAQAKMADALGVSTRTVRRLMATAKKGSEDG